MPRYIPGAACWWPMVPKPLVHRRSSARCKSRRWRLLVYTGREGHPLAEPPPEGARLPSGSTTAGPWPVVSKCALREGRQKERSTQVIPGRSPFGSLLLVDHRLSGLCHFATNEPSANVYLGGETTLYTIHLSRIVSAGRRSPRTGTSVWCADRTPRSCRRGSGARPPGDVRRIPCAGIHRSPRFRR